jgi:Na+-driven multidrug efflux pump
MGTAYGQAGLVLAILALGRIAPIAQTTVMSVLTGMNLHGRPGLAHFIAAVCALGLSILALSTLQWGLVGAALAVTIPQTLASGIYVTMYACRQVDLPLRRYLSASLKGPLLCSVPYVLALAGGRIAFTGQPMLALVCGGGLGTMVIALIYWRYVLPDSLKERVASRIVPQRFRGGLESA